jgi:glycosyltransferase involved in cell wall biosynthesis
MIPSEVPELTSDRPIVSVVMANFNGAAHLADAIRSVQNQTLRDLEIVVSDDGSTDDSVDIVMQLKETDPRIRLIRSDRNGGPAAARNRALDVVKGEWVAIMDSDDLIHPERLATLVKLADRDGADIVADDLVEFESDHARPSRRLLKGKWAHEPLLVDIIDYVRCNHFYGAGPALGYLKPLLRTSIVKGRAICYDETLRIAEDYNLVLCLLHSGTTMRVYPLQLYYYRKHSKSISHRLNEDALAALKVADLRFLAQVSREERRLADEIRTRIRSIDVALAYEELLAAIKGRRWSEVVAIALSQPRAAALLRLPIGVRLRRLIPHGEAAGPELRLISPGVEELSQCDQGQDQRRPAKLRQ